MMCQLAVKVNWLLMLYLIKNNVSKRPGAGTSRSTGMAVVPAGTGKMLAAWLGKVLITSIVLGE